MIFATVSGGAAVANGVLILGGNETDDTTLIPGSTMSTDQLTTRADVVLAGGVFMVLVAVLMYQSAAVWARVLVTLATVAAVAFSVVLIADVADPPTAILSVITIIGGVVAVVLSSSPAKRPSACAAR
jgi:hypothetical protein